MGGFLRKVLSAACIAPAHTRAFQRKEDDRRHSEDSAPVSLPGEVRQRCQRIATHSDDSKDSLAGTPGTACCSQGHTSGTSLFSTASTQVALANSRSRTPDACTPSPEDACVKDCDSVALDEEKRMSGSSGQTEASGWTAPTAASGLQEVDAAAILDDVRLYRVLSYEQTAGMRSALFQGQCI